MSPPEQPRREQGWFTHGNPGVKGQRRLPASTSWHPPLLKGSPLLTSAISCSQPEVWQKHTVQAPPWPRATISACHAMRGPSSTMRRRRCDPASQLTWPGNERPYSSHRGGHGQHQGYKKKKKKRAELCSSSSLGSALGGCATCLFPMGAECFPAMPRASNNLQRRCGGAAHPYPPHAFHPF